MDETFWHQSSRGAREAHKGHLVAFHSMWVRVSATGGNLATVGVYGRFQVRVGGGYVKGNLQESSEYRNDGGELQRAGC